MMMMTLRTIDEDKQEAIHLIKQSNHIQRSRLETLSTLKHHSLDSEDDFRLRKQNVSH